MITFPKDFIWGTACAAYQCEGAWDEDGRGKSIWDDFSHSVGKVKNADTGDTACDSYHRWLEDISIMKALGVKTHRFSISWPRIQPEGKGSVNQKGLDHYERIVDAMLQEGIEPWVTLYHWDLPSALQQDGGWLNSATADYFAEYSAIIARRFGSRVRCYMPVNEPQCISIQGYGDGSHAPGLCLDYEAVAKVLHNLALGHSLSAKSLRANSSHALSVGTVTCGRLCYPVSPSPLAEQAAYRASFALSDSSLHSWAFTHNIYLDSLFFKKYDSSAPEFLRRFAEAIPQKDWDAMEKPDFLGANIYNGNPVDEHGALLSFPAGSPRTAIAWPITPEVMYYGTRQLYERYGLPIVICENGISCNDRVYLDGKVHDADRIDFLKRYLSQLNQSLQSGTPIKGYLHWSLLDNFEWAEGYAQRFGLVHVDYQSLERTLKDSAYWYSELMKTGSFSL